MAAQKGIVSRRGLNAPMVLQTGPIIEAITYVRKARHTIVACSIANGCKLSQALMAALEVISRRTTKAFLLIQAGLRFPTPIAALKLIVSGRHQNVGFFTGTDRGAISNHIVECHVRGHLITNSWMFCITPIQIIRHSLLTGPFILSCTESTIPFKGQIYTHICRPAPSVTLLAGDNGGVEINRI